MKAKIFKIVANPNEKTNAAARGDDRSRTPVELGFRMPAEWEPQAAIWLTWPTNPELWPGFFEPLLEQYSAFVAAISHFEPVCLNCAAGTLQTQATRFLNAAKADLSAIRFFDHAANDVWCRDHGPLFVKNDATGEVALTDWIFNGWGGKFEAALDNAIPLRIAESLGMRRFAFPFELEGGAVELSGDGLLLTTECVQKNPNRSRGRDDAAFARALKNGLGVREILWISNGLANDDTDGHIDNLARFVAPRAILTSVESDRASPNFAPLAENLAQLRALRTPEGGKFDVLELPLPSPFTLAGRELPPSYANFLVLNDAVLVPVYGQSGDARALGIIGEAFPRRKIVGLDARIILIEGGSFHCLSQQQPAAGTTRRA